MIGIRHYSMEPEGFEFLRILGPAQGRMYEEFLGLLPKEPKRTSPSNFEEDFKGSDVFTLGQCTIEGSSEGILSGEFEGVEGRVRMEAHIHPRMDPWVELIVQRGDAQYRIRDKLNDEIGLITSTTSAGEIKELDQVVADLKRMRNLYRRIFL